jgi:flagellar hook-basal body complex protein FliE
MRIDAVPANPVPATPASLDVKPARSFSDLLANAAGQVNHSQLYVENLIERTAAGESINPAILASAVNKTDVAWRTMIQIRNKLTSAFDELRMMQV